MKRIFVSMVALLLLITLIQCSDNTDNSVNTVVIDGRNNQYSTAPVIITNVWPRGFTLIEVNVSGNVLTAIAVHSGGCTETFYECFMLPTAFLESDPVQANLHIRSSGEPDPCLTVVTDTVYFDLTPVADLYLAHYGSLDEIVLNVYEFGTDNKLVVSYNPALE